MPPKFKAKHDKYCWNCSKVRTTITCTSCVRTFHEGCITNDLSAAGSVSSDYICTVCKSFENYVCIDNPNHLQMIPLMMEFLINDLSFVSLKDITFTKTGGRLVNKLDISRIKVNSSNYSSFFELQIDISWFIHNCLIEFSKNEVVCQAAKNLAKFVDEEIESIKKCIECYEKAYKFPMESFVMPCDKPHLLVWAQAPGWVFWPAKAMSVTNGSIHVRFFEDHSVLNLPPTECFLFSDPSKHYPGNKKCTSETFLAALKEANAYIDNVRQKFGAFIYAPQKTPLNPEKLQDHVNDMIGKKTVLNALSTTQKSNDESTINVVVSNLDAIPKSPAMVAGHNQTVVNITNQRKTSIQNYPENNQKRYEPPNKKIRVGSGSDSDEELLQNYLVQSRQKKKQKDEEIEAYKRRIFEEEQKMATQKKDHANEIQDLEKDFDHSKKTFQSQISEKDQEIVLLKEKIAQLEQEITNRSQKKTELLCFECGEASDSVFFCSNQCTNNHFKKHYSSIGTSNESAAKSQDV